jgi:hypothetical protein
LADKNSSSGLNETAESSDNSTLNASSDSNSTNNATSNATSNATENEAHSVAYYYPYYRAVRDPSDNKKADDEKKPYEPRPAKYKNNYEDPGLKVFKPEGFKPFIGTFAEKY